MLKNCYGCGLPRNYGSNMGDYEIKKNSKGEWLCRNTDNPCYKGKKRKLSGFEMAILRGKGVVE